MPHAVDKELHEYIALLNVEQKESLLSIVRSFITKKRISTEEYNAEIDAAVLRINNGDYITREDIDKEAEQW